MKNISEYDFYKTKYGSELLIDVVELQYIKKYLPAKSLHTLTYYDITLITQGEGFFRIDNTGHHVNAKEILFSLPHQLREWDTQNISHGYALIFKEEFLISFFNDPHFLDNISYFNINRTNNKLKLSSKEFDQINNLILQIKHEIDEYTEKNKHILRALLYQALMCLERIFTEKNNVSPKGNKSTHADRFLKLVHAGFDKNHTVKYYAEKLNLTPNYLNELSKRDIGISAKQVIQNRLITESKKYLLYSNFTITEISDRLSFETPSYFIRFFHKHTGYTPLQFRKKEKP